MAISASLIGQFGGASVTMNTATLTEVTGSAVDHHLGYYDVPSGETWIIGLAGTLTTFDSASPLYSPIIFVDFAENMQMQDISSNTVYQWGFSDTVTGPAGIAVGIQTKNSSASRRISFSGHTFAVKI